jgi:hypothetical protein
VIFHCGSSQHGTSFFYSKPTRGYTNLGSVEACVPASLTFSLGLIHEHIACFSRGARCRDSRPKREKSHKKSVILRVTPISGQTMSKLLLFCVAAFEFLCNNTMCPADNATAGSLGRRRAGQLRFGFVAVLKGHIVCESSFKFLTVFCGF